MDYNYIHLQNQIKALMNKNYVPSSSHAASATELKNGSNSILVDTVQKYFVFKYAGLNESVMVNPINRSLLNVAYINGVDVSKLIGGVMAGYGITIENQGEGVYKISVTDEMFALKSDLESIDNKLGDYVTNEGLNAKLGDEFIDDETLTIAKFVKDGDGAINDKLTNDYYAKTECDGKYALRTDTYTKMESDNMFAPIKIGKEDYKIICEYSYFYDLNIKGWIICCNEGFALWIDGTINGHDFSFKSIITSGFTINIDDIDFPVTTTQYEGETVLVIVDELKQLQITSVGQFSGASYLASVVYNDEVYTKTECDEKYALKGDVGNVDLSSYYTKTESDGKYALKSDGYIENRMSLSTSSYSSETTYNASVGDRFKLGVRVGGGAASYHTVILTDAFKTEAGQKFEVDAYHFIITFNAAYTRLVFKPNSTELVLSSLFLETPNNVVYHNEVYTKTECDEKYALTSSTYTKTEVDNWYNNKQWVSGESLQILSTTISEPTVNGTYRYQIDVKFSDTIYSGNFAWGTWWSGKYYSYSASFDNGVKISGDDRITLSGDTITAYCRNDGDELRYVSANLFGKKVAIQAPVASTYELEEKYYTKFDCDSKFVSFDRFLVIYSQLANLVKNQTTTSTTITHYAPIEGNIDDFKVGLPVFASGKVFNRVQNEWFPSSVNDRKDCISSVQLMGNHKTYLGVVVDIDKENNSITFASHGDFMFNVEESNLYEVGDVVLYDGRILEDDIIVTSAHLQSVVGKITAIIDEHTLAIFKD